MAIQAVSIPTKRLATSILSTDMSFQLNNILSWDGTNNLTSADFPTRGFGVFRNSTNTQIEFFEFDPTTIASSSITIISRGLGYDGGLTANTETKYNWNANESFCELGSDAPQIFQLLRDYIDAALIAGAANATTTLQGLVELATQAEVDAGTATGATGAKLVATPDLIRAKAYHDYAVDSVGTDSYAITITPAITAYAAGQRFTFKAGTANTGACTLNVSALGAKDIKKNYNEALITGDILANQIVEVVYDGTNMQMVSNLTPAAPVLQVYTSSGTWTKPTGLKYIIVEVVGGGGGGGGGTESNEQCGGGGGGGYSKEVLSASVLGATETYTVGAAGTAGAGTGANGGAGGTSSFGTSPFLQATGGAGGQFGGGAGFDGGAGGIGSSGTLNVVGGAGSPGSNLTTDSSGNGGSSVYGGGGIGRGVTNAGGDGQLYGGGGGGANSNGGDTVGGAGAAGVVIVTEFFS